ncbi:hypothetical protein [Curvivirga sp.]|uniref:hypothetical protein n=1 Tax=Curvivirga sp. TaxID=2856848 RepID=UPI003B5960AA
MCSNKNWPAWLQVKWEAKASFFARTVQKKVKTELNNLMIALTGKIGTEEVKRYALSLKEDQKMLPKNRHTRLGYLKRGLDQLIPELDTVFICELLGQLNSEMRPTSGEPRKATRDYPHKYAIPFEGWPRKDRALWNDLMRSPTSKIAGYSEPMIKTYRDTYGQWVKHREEAGLGYGQETLELVDSFLEKINNRDITSHTRSNIVQRIISVICDFEKLEEEQVDEFLEYEETGDLDEKFEDLVLQTQSEEFLPYGEAEEVLTVIEYLQACSRMLKRQAIPEKGKAARIVSPHDLYFLGKSLCEAAKKNPVKSTEMAVQYRNGLMIQFLSHRPVRLSNLMDLGIKQGKDQLCFGGTIDLENWETIWPAAQMKNRHILKIPLPEIIREDMDTYLKSYRPILKGSNPTTQLWLSREGGRPLSAGQFESKVKKLTKQRLGVDVSPHLFRDSNAQLLVKEDLLWAIPNILGHLSEKSSETYKGQAEAYHAWKVQRQNIQKITEDSVF